MPAGELVLDRLLPAQQPVQGLVQFHLAGFAHVQFLRQRALPPACDGVELAGREEQARGDHRQDQVALTGAARGQEPVQPEFADRPQHGLDLSVGKAGGDGQRLRRIAAGLAAQRPAQGLDLGGRQMAEIGQGAFLDFVANACGFTQEDGRGRGAVGDGLDVHGHIIPGINLIYKYNIHYLHGYKSAGTKWHNPMSGH